MEVCGPIDWRLAETKNGLQLGARFRSRMLVVIELGDGLADGGLVQELFLVDQAGHERGGADLIDSSRQTLGVLEDSSHGILREERAGGVAGGPDVVPHVADGLGQIQRAEMIAHGYTLAE